MRYARRRSVDQISTLDRVQGKTFMLLYTYVGDMAERRQAHRPAHVAYLTTSRDNGTLVLAGAFPEVDGALLLLEAETPGAVLAWAANDPYNTAGLIRSMTVREVNVAIRR